MVNYLGGGWAHTQHSMLSKALLRHKKSGWRCKEICRVYSTSEILKEEPVFHTPCNIITINRFSAGCKCNQDKAGLRERERASKINHHLILEKGGIVKSA